MATSPILLKEFPKKVDNVREKFYNDESDKIIGRKGIILNSFQTEKERIVRIQL